MKEKTKEITKIILLSLGALTLLTAVAVAPGLTVLLKEISKRKKYDNWRVNQAIKRLKSQKLVKLKESKDGEITIEFTQKGKTRFLKYKLNEMKIKKPKKWDKKWRIVVFDIPENKKIARDVLRRKLKDLGFLKLQKSVFIYPYDCRDEIDSIKELYEVHPFVNFIEATFVDNEEKLKKLFELTKA